MSTLPMNSPSLYRPFIDLHKISSCCGLVFNRLGSWQADLDRLFVICAGTIKFTRGLESFAATVVGCRVPRIYLNRVGVIRDRLIDFPLRAVSEAAMIEGVGILRGDLNSLSEICDRAIVVALGLEGAAAAKVGIAVQRIDLDRLAIVCDCAVDFAFSSVDGGTIVVSLGTAAGRCRAPC